MDIAPFPLLPLGPTPERLPGNSVVGIRRPVTTYADGSVLTRKLGIAFQRYFVPLEIQGEGWTGKVVEGKGIVQNCALAFQGRITSAMQRSLLRSLTVDGNNRDQCHPQVAHFSEQPM